MKKKQWLTICVKNKQCRVTEAQLCLYGHLRELGHEPSLEVKVCADREWRFDKALPYSRLAFECNGGQWHGGHRRGKKVDDEYDKLNRAQMEGWRVIQFSNEAIIRGDDKPFLEKYLG